MKALIFEEAGKAETALKLKNIEQPTPGEGQLLIKVKSSPIHPADYIFIAGKYRYQPVFPQIAGLEGAGFVELAGSNTQTSAGTLVSFSRLGSWAEFVVVDEKDVIVLTDGFDIDKAAQMQLNPYTAWGLLKEANVTPGDWLLLTSGNSTVSRLIIQLAAQIGVNTIAVIRDQSQTQQLLDIKAGAVIVPETGKLKEQINAITGSKGIKAALDAVGGPFTTEIIDALAPGSHLVVYGLLSPDPVSYFNAQVVFKNLIIKGFGVRGFVANLKSEEKEQMTKQLVNSISRPDFQLPAQITFALSDFKDALTYKGTGKVLFKFD
jgi:NADPH2:quinone reductase